MNTIVLLALFPVCILCAAQDTATASFAEKHVPPPGVAIADVKLQAFVNSLNSIVQSRDVTGLLLLLHPEVKVDFGGASGVKDFRRAWQLDTNAPESPLWKALAAVLAFEGTGDEDHYNFPYFFRLWPQGFDEYLYALITGE